jgi:hypothetical protein
MGKAKRCRSIMLSASVAVLATGACPVADAASKAALRPRATREPRPASLRGPFVYEVLAGAEISAESANMACVGERIRISGVTLSPEGPNEHVGKVPSRAKDSFQLSLKNPAAWEKPHTITTGQATTITASWTDEVEKEELRENGSVANHTAGPITIPASRLCAATTPNAPVGSLGRSEVTWRLTKPVKSLTALLHQPPTNIHLNEYIARWEILLNGTVPTFSPY